MLSTMILSASGWRKVFAKSGGSQDKTAEISENDKAIAFYAGYAFSDYIKIFSKNDSPCIVCAMDSRPTGAKICNSVIRSLILKNVNVQFAGITSAPEIMAYAKEADGFIYISASHNPIGYNGIKFGLNSGGVLNSEENEKLVQIFKSYCNAKDSVQKAIELNETVTQEQISKVYEMTPAIKQSALDSYKSFLRTTIAGSTERAFQEKVFESIRTYTSKKKIGVVCDMNGSARCASIDSQFFKENGIKLYAINNIPGEIVHEIIPEAENLEYCANEMTRLQKEGHKDAVLGYVPDCDGDRGNIVYWNEIEKKAVILKAQEVFSLSVLAELSYLYWKGREKSAKTAIAVNGPTSMRIDEIAVKFNAEIFRSEVGEANVVNLAKEKRLQGYEIPILGEGSNGGTITYPSEVRDPLNTIFAIIKLLTLREDGLFKFWCSKTGFKYKQGFTLSDILASLPVYTTTGVSESKAILTIHKKTHAVLKAEFQKIFEKEYEQNIKTLTEKYGITNYQTVITNGTVEKRNVNEFSLSGNGGLKIVFFDKHETPLAFMWMRGSKTEPVFRIMCDVKGNNKELEEYLINWETKMLLEADKK